MLKNRKYHAIALIVVLAAVLTLLSIVAIRDDGLDWISWKEENTYPHRDTFEIREEGEYGYFGGVKIAYNLPVKQGDWICVRIDTDNPAYEWEVLVYWERTMIGFIWVKSGEWRCHQIEWLPEPATLHKIHWIGIGHGGVTAKPTVVISDESLERRLMPGRVEP